jgi:hypothetical protein
MRLHPDIRAALPASMIDPLVRYPLPLAAELARWYVYLPEEGHCIMAVPRGHWNRHHPADALVAVPVRTAQAADYTVTPSGHLVMALPLTERSAGVRIDERDREYAHA